MTTTYTDHTLGIAGMRRVTTSLARLEPGDEYELEDGSVHVVQEKQHRAISVIVSVETYRLRTGAVTA